MKYYELEHAPVEEVLQFRNSFKLEYQKQLDTLMKKKQELYKKDITQWQFKGSLDELISRSNTLKNKEEAYKYMLTEDTQKVHEISEELNFYTNQLLDECRRVGKYNGESLIDHFMDQARIQ